ncbi:T9SS type A sorting domain-containing protein [candidate division KSB1 bacterium]|nr:T9SS type A sorting domain-containing protein [candidate division KSB1 bacterium]
MKFIVAILTLVVLFSSHALAQNFNFISDTLTKHGQPGETIVLDADIINLSQQELQLRVERLENNLPSGWTSSLCGGELCFPPFTHSYTIPDSSLGIPELAPGDTSEFHLNFYSNEIADVGTAMIRVVNLNDTTEFEELFFTASTQPVYVKRNEKQQPAKFRLHQNYPNPFNPVTTIRFEICGKGFAEVRLAIYNATGQIITILVSEKFTSGNYEVEWNATDRRGNLLPSGMYLIEMRSGTNRTISKMMLLQ